MLGGLLFSPFLDDELDDELFPFLDPFLDDELFPVPFLDPFLSDFDLLSLPPFFGLRCLVFCKVKNSIQVVDEVASHQFDTVSL